MGFFDFVRRIADPLEIFGSQDIDEENDPFASLSRLIDPAGELLAGRSTVEEFLDPIGLFADEELPDIEDLAVDEDADTSLAEDIGATPAALSARRRALARKGRQSTFRTGGGGVVQTAVTGKPTLIRKR